mmetsp:Transcript_23862/g.52122  ORF Transcript_23862/g.52122 Transcript_23862/m.52122 type:complete len:93 (+) Transcript_23862:263-541(+)
MFGVTSKFPVPILYRHILKAAARFPSTNRTSIIAEIKEEFHQSRALTDNKEIARRRALAVDGLKKLEEYSSIDKNSSQWEVYMKGMEHKFDH